MAPTDRVLRQYLAGALEPPRVEEVEEALRGAEVRERLALLRATTVDVPTPAFQVPPPWASGPRALSGTWAAGAVMDAGEADWIEVRLGVADADLDRTVVVLERRQGAWAVLFPATADEVITAADLPTADDGTRRLDVVLPTPGSRRLAVALAGAPPDFDTDDPWADLKVGLRRGTVPTRVFDI